MQNFTAYPYLNSFSPGKRMVSVKKYQNSPNLRKPDSRPWKTVHSTFNSLARASNLHPSMQNCMVYRFHLSFSPSKRMVNMKKIKKRLNTIKNWWFSFWKPLATTWLHLPGHQTCKDRCKIAWAIDSIIRSLPANDQSRRNCPKCHKTPMSTKVNLLNRSYNRLWEVN